MINENHITPKTRSVNSKKGWETPIENLQRQGDNMQVSTTSHQEHSSTQIQLQNEQSEVVQSTESTLSPTQEVHEGTPSFLDYPENVQKYMTTGAREKVTLAHYLREADRILNPLDKGSKVEKLAERLLGCSESVSKSIKERVTKYEANLCGFTHLCPVCKGIFKNDKQTQVNSLIDSINLENKHVIHFKFSYPTAIMEKLKHVIGVYHRIIRSVQSTYLPSLDYDLFDDADDIRKSFGHILGSVSEFVWKVNVSPRGHLQFDATLDLFLVTKDKDTTDLIENIEVVFDYFMDSSKEFEQLQLRSSITELGSNIAPALMKSTLMMQPTQKNFTKHTDYYVTKLKDVFGLFKWLMIFGDIVYNHYNYDAGVILEDRKHHTIYTIYPEKELSVTDGVKVFKRPPIRTLKANMLN